MVCSIAFTQKIFVNRGWCILVVSNKIEISVVVKIAICGAAGKVALFESPVKRLIRKGEVSVIPECVIVDRRGCHCTDKVERVSLFFRFSLFKIVVAFVFEEVPVGLVSVIFDRYY